MLSEKLEKVTATYYAIILYVICVFQILRCNFTKSLFVDVFVSSFKMYAQLHIAAQILCTLHTIVLHYMLCTPQIRKFWAMLTNFSCEVLVFLFFSTKIRFLFNLTFYQVSKSRVFCISKSWAAQLQMKKCYCGAGSCNYILFAKMPWPGYSKGTLRSSSQAATCPAHLSTTHREASLCALQCWTSSRKAVNTDFCSLWYDPTRNRTRVYRSSSRSSIQHSATVRFAHCTSDMYTIALHNTSYTSQCENENLHFVMTKDGSTLRYVQNLRTTYLAPSAVPYQRTVLQFKFWSVPYPYHYKKGVPYFLAKIEVYQTVLTYRTVLPSLLLTTQNFTWLCNH